MGMEATFGIHAERGTDVGNAPAFALREAVRNLSRSLPHNLLTMKVPRSGLEPETN